MIPKRQLPNQQIVSEWVLKTIAACRLLLGSYMNITESKPVCYFMKLYCICFSAVVISNYFDEVYEQNIFPLFLVSIFEYAWMSFLSLLYDNNLFFNFFAAIKTNDRIIGFERISLITRYTYLIIFVNSVMRFGITVAHGSTTTKSDLGHLCILLTFTALDLQYLTNIIIFALLQNRMKCLRLFVASNSVPICITARNNVANSIRNVRKSLVYYNNLLDYLEGLGQQIQSMVHLIFTYIFFALPELVIDTISFLSLFFLLQLFVNWVCYTSRVIILLYSITVFYSTGHYTDLFLGTLTTGVVHSKVMIYSPAVIVEVTIREVEKIKAILTTQILRTSGNRHNFNCVRKIIDVQKNDAA